MDVRDGVEYWLNPADPIFSPDSVLTIERWTAPGRVADAEHAFWENPTGLALNTGSVYVLDSNAGMVHVVSRRDGEWESSFGRKGNGPGELSRPYGLEVLDDAIFVGDGGKGAFSVWTASGVFENEIRLPGTIFGMTSLSNETLLLRGLRGNQGAWLTFDTESGEFSTMALPDTEDDFPAAAPSCWKTHGGPTQILRVNCTEPIVQILDRAGEVLSFIHLDVPAVSYDESEFAHIEQLLRRSISEVGYSTTRAEAEVSRQMDTYNLKRVWQGIRFDAATGMFYLWEQDPPELGPGNAVLHVLSPQGIYLSRISLPYALVDVEIDDSVAYALIEEAETGLRTLRALGIQLPTGWQEIDTGEDRRVSRAGPPHRSASRGSAF